MSEREPPTSESLARTPTPLVPMRTAEVVGWVKLVREITKEVMQEDVHYGKIPGTQKRSLWQPGAEVLCVAFRLVPTYVVEDHCRPEDPADDPRAAVYRYATTCELRHQETGNLIATATREASTNEERWKWRVAVDSAEFEATPQVFRRIKRRGGRKDVQQVRTLPTDLANTVRAMASKRALVGATRTATAASDVFSEELEALKAAGIEPGSAENGDRPDVGTPRAMTDDDRKYNLGKREPDPPRGQPIGEELPADVAAAIAAEGGALLGSVAQAGADAAAALGSNIAEAAWVSVSSSWHKRGTINTSQVNRLLAIAAQTHQRCLDGALCRGCSAEGVKPRAPRAGWRFDDVRLVLRHNLGYELEALPYGEPYEAVVAIFDQVEPGTVPA